MLQIAFLRGRFLVILIGLASCTQNSQMPSLPYYNSASFDPAFYNDQATALREINHQIPAFSFTDQEGKQITEKDISGKIHVANFIFTRCVSICPAMTKNMKLVQAEFKNPSEVVILSYSVTPWMDSVPRLKSYADNQGISYSNWHLLTGSQDEIYKLARQGYFAEEDLGFSKDSTDFLHTEHVLLIDRTRRIRGIYNGTLTLDMQQLIEDIKNLQAEDPKN